MNPMTPLLILFDIDGTLVDTAGAGKRAIERAFSAMWPVDPSTPRRNSVRYSGMTDPGIFRALAEAFEIDPDQYHARRDRLCATYLEALRAEMGRPDPGRRVLPGVAALLARLTRTESAHLGLVTGNVEGGAQIKLDAFDLFEYFGGGGFGSDHEERALIARRARLRMSSIAGIDFPADRVVVVGDTEHDVACARANGFRAVAVATGRIPPDTLRASRPDAIFSDLGDVGAVCAALGVG